MSAVLHTKSDSEKIVSAGRFVHRRRGFTLLEMLAVMAILSIISVALFTIFQQGTDTWRLSAAHTEAFLKARQILEMMSRELKGAVLIPAARGAKSDPSGTMPKRADFVGLDSDNLEDWRSDQQDHSDQIYFVSPVTNSGKQELCMIGYWVRDDDILMRKYLTDGLTDPDPGHSYGKGEEDPGEDGDGGGSTGRVGPHEDWLKFDFSSNKGFRSNQVASSVRQLDIKYYDYVDNGGTSPELEEFPAWDSLPSIEGGTTADKDDDDRLPVAAKITVTVTDKDNIIKGLTLSTIVYLENARRRQPQ